MTETLASSSADRPRRARLPLSQLARELGACGNTDPGPDPTHDSDPIPSRSSR